MAIEIYDIATTASPAPKERELFERSITEILSQASLNYKTAGNYLQVGEITNGEGWTIDISIILIQLEELLELVLPILIDRCIPFKVPTTLDMAKCILNGEYGYGQLGKVVSIYPDENENLLALAHHLLTVTSHLRGPNVLTDRHLGGVIYTRYGSYNAESYTIPFILPPGITWPFGEITSPDTPIGNTILQNKYKPFSILKEDPRGTVKKVLWLKSLFQIKWCILKQGIREMVTDKHGRDIRDRLRWQYQLQKDLFGLIPLPKAYDLFEENGDLFFSMEYIRGKSLDETTKATFEFNTWQQLPLTTRKKQISHALNLLEAIGRMHEQEFIHRDITPANFLVTKKRGLVLIDLELTYSHRLKWPMPPFRLGTPWFMSKEQEAGKKPTIYDDIYSLGAVLIVLFTGLFPNKFELDKPETLEEQLRFYLPDSSIVLLISTCFNTVLSQRPTIPQMKACLNQFINNQPEKYQHPADPSYLDKVNQSQLKMVIAGSINGLVNPNFLNRDSLWLSNSVQNAGLPYAPFSGFHTGVSGPLYTIALAQTAGYNISKCREAYENNLSFLQKKALLLTEELPGGLYFGTAGMALAIAEGIKSGLIPCTKDIKDKIQTCQQNPNIDGFGIETGIVGKGLALLQCSNILDESYIQQHLSHILQVVLDNQQDDGSWIWPESKGRRQIRITGLSNGVAGISCFLLAYAAKYGDSNASKSAEKALTWLISKSYSFRKQVLWNLHDKSNSVDIGMSNGFTGIALAFIRAYSFFNNCEEYRRVAESTLRNIQPYILTRDLSLANGLAGIGQVYLEASNTFGSDEWKSRVDWITRIILNSVKYLGDESCYWMVDSSPNTTADFMTGNSGVMHFLLRYSECGTPNLSSMPI
jgi:serine/threonine protein kinase